MDCDFSHDPADVPRLLGAAESADLALGSRYVEGGGTRNWGMGRRAISRFGSFYARTILGVGVRDLTGGFKCWRREVARSDAARRGSRRRATPSRSRRPTAPSGPALEVVEVPIVFAEREAGGSKMSRGIVLEAVWKVPALRAARRPGSSVVTAIVGPW